MKRRVLVEPPVGQQNQKSCVETIRQRFDQDVERFSNLEVGQQAAVDGALAIDLIAQASSLVAPKASHVLDLGCGAGNFSLRLREYYPQAEFTLVDLSQPMLSRAEQRMKQAGCQNVTTIQQDLRLLEIPDASVDIIVAAAVLHHLRTPDQWQQMFQQCYRWLQPGGAIWVYDLVESDHPAVSQLMWSEYAAYLVELNGEEYQQTVFEYIAAEDSPFSLTQQLEMMKSAGFTKTEVVHKKACFAAYGAIKSSEISPTGALR